MKVQTHIWTTQALLNVIIGRKSETDDDGSDTDDGDDGCDGDEVKVTHSSINYTV